MTRRQAGIERLKRPTRPTRRRSLNSYCRPLQQVGIGLYQDAYGQQYRANEKSGALEAIR
jgi:hypothetical protein